jgi:hypothetical protein
MSGGSSLPGCVVTPPAHSRSFDVLGIIFLYLQDSETFYQQRLEDLTQVCRAWRIAALAYRRLWARILIDIENCEPPSRYQYSQRRLCRYLKRSVAAPLSVEISLTSDVWPPANPTSIAQIQDLIALTAQEISRWETLSINFEEVEEPERESWEPIPNPIFLLKPLCSPAPSLRHLLLHGVQGSFSSFLPQVPSLKTLALQGGDIIDLNLPWSSLTSFRYSSTGYGNDYKHLSQLSRCVQLRDLSIESIQSPTDGSYGLESAFNCSLPNVVSFQLDRYPHSTSLLELRLPSLQNLTLVVPHSFSLGEDDWDGPKMTTAEHIVGFAETCKVLTLRWKDPTTPLCYVPPGAKSREVTSRTVIVDMFKAVPDLEELRLADRIAELFQEVIGEDETLVPKLSRIFILDAKGGEALVARGQMTGTPRWVGSFRYVWH